MSVDDTTSHSCLVTAKWEWTESNKTGRWSTPQQAYKRQRVWITDALDTPNDDGFGVINTKLKLRGKGRSLLLRYESEDGKDFQLLGWAIPFTATGAP